MVFVPLCHGKVFENVNHSLLSGLQMFNLVKRHLISLIKRGKKCSKRFLIKILDCHENGNFSNKHVFYQQEFQICTAFGV